MEKKTLQNVLVDQQKEIIAKDLWWRRVDIFDHLNSPEISVITGVRRCGKSSLLSLIAQELESTEAIFYLNFEDIRLISFNVEDFQRAFDAWLEMRPVSPEKIFFFYDEIQIVENWQRWIAHLAKNKKYKVFITGSNSKMLSGELASFLTGRHRPISLYPFSYTEIAQHIFGEKLQALEVWHDSNMRLEFRRLLLRYIELGGFPRVYLSGERSLLSQYFVDIVLKDIAIRRNIRNEKALLELGTILMNNATHLVNKSKLAKTIGIKDSETASSYIHYLGETFLGFEVKCYHHSAQKVVRSQSKFYAVDHALSSFVGGSASPDAGAVLEGMVYVELLRRGYTPMYWRSEKDLEVDFVIKRGRTITHALQVCVSLLVESTREREVRALKAAAEELKPGLLQIVTLDTDVFSGMEGIEILTFEEWALRG
jgi:predicted AAA+ superfamily ATPase